jgi:hypothetical protein
MIARSVRSHGSRTSRLGNREIFDRYVRSRRPTSRIPRRAWAARGGMNKTSPAFGASGRCPITGIHQDAGARTGAMEFPGLISLQPL